MHLLVYRGIDQECGLMKMKGTGRSMVFSYDELRSHFPYLVPESPVISVPQTQVSAVYLQDLHARAQLQELQAHASSRDFHGQAPSVQEVHAHMPLQSYPAYVSSPPHPYHPSSMRCTAVSLSSETSAFEPIYASKRKT